METKERFCRKGKRKITERSSERGEVRHVVRGRKKAGGGKEKNDSFSGAEEIPKKKKLNIK